MSFKRSPSEEPKTAARTTELEKTVEAMKSFVDAEMAHQSAKENKKREKAEAKQREEQERLAREEVKRLEELKKLKKLEKIWKREADREAMAKAIEISVGLRFGTVDDRLKNIVREVITEGLLPPKDKGKGPEAIASTSGSANASEIKGITKSTEGLQITEKHKRGSPEHEILSLWTSQTFDGRFLRNNVRIINNSLSLASSRLKQPSDGVRGFQGQLRAQGPIFHRVGALAVGEGKRPQFAQLYLHDPQRLDDAIDQRLNFLNLPARTSDDELDRAKHILRRFHELLQQCNNYVKDFMTVAHLPPKVLNGRKLVINPDVMPDEEHARRYNRPMGLHEVCVLIVDELLPRELEIRLHAPLPGERQTVVVPECSRVHDCLRTIIMFLVRLNVDVRKGIPLMMLRTWLWREVVTIVVPMGMVHVEGARYCGSKSGIEYEYEHLEMCGCCNSSRLQSAKTGSIETFEEYRCKVLQRVSVREVLQEYRSGTGSYQGNIRTETPQTSNGCASYEHGGSSPLEINQHQKGDRYFVDIDFVDIDFVDIDFVGGQMLQVTRERLLEFEEKRVLRDGGGLQWVRCPMGICNAPATFQRAMNVTFQNFVNKTWLTQGMINFCVIVYMDDVLVYSKTYHGHAQHIEWTLGALRDVGFKIALEKSEFFLSEILFLGYMLTRGGLRPDSRKVTAVKDAPVPTSLMQVRAFLGLASYYRRFIKGFAAIARPLTNLLRKDQPLNWDAECEQAFTTLKDALATTPILIRPDPMKQFIFITDWQPEAISAILGQKGNDD
ncbi:hypothetical protein CBR_g18838 [Chara braunii]|uniref:Reverse transcriptase domain-containing protein n=1 Tax=Chara braunii TaxID=69332 RepID=A0A388KWI6_CHABU|nr:hypothetical protein CBR_g18838 [Chara braunii]|eukprot:GBG74426.1 hypothetical protein CBR_g18838 [Chara braunii]